LEIVRVVVVQKVKKGDIMKKGQGLSLNTIIIAAIVLIVLVVLWAIFTGRMGTFATGVKETENCDDACKAIGKTKADSCTPAAGSEPEGFVKIGKIKGADCCCKTKTGD